MTEREQTLEYLTDDVGLSLEEAERRMRDDDLWLVPPYLRDGLPDTEESVKQWEYAVRFTDWLTDDHPGANEAVQTLAWDMAERAREALRRAKRRAEEANSAVRGS